jgi:hypothetical protein
MVRVYDYYGSRESGIKGVMEAVARATGATFASHHSDYVDAYYLSSESPGEELTVRSNELVDEEGPFRQWPEYGEYPTIVFARCAAPAGTSSFPYLDALREKLGQAGELTFIERKQHSGKARPGSRDPGPA